MFIARLAPLFFLILAAQSKSQTPPDPLTSCGDLNADTSIAACTALLTSTDLPADTLANVYTYRGFSYLKKNQYDHAIEDFNQAIHLNPDNAWALANRGNAYFNTRQPERALQDYDQALKLNPAGYATLFYGRGAIDTGMGDYQHAIADFDQAILLQPEFPEAFNNRGIAYFDSGQYGRAIEDYTQALHFRSDYASALHNRGNAYAARGQYDRALEDYNKSIDLQPAPAALRNRGNLYRAKGDYEKALADLNASMHSLASPAALDDRGDIYLELGQSARALDDFSAAVRSQAAVGDIDPDILQSKARAEFNLGQWNDAVADFQKSLSLDTSNPYALIWLHLASARAEKNDEAALREQALSVHPAAWPAPIVDLLLGKLKPSYAIAFASDPDADKTTTQRCEAEFYVGEYMLTQNNTEAAIPHLQEARRICSGIFAESLAAKMELKRMEGAPKK